MPAGTSTRAWYVGAALRRVTANLCACAAATVATVVLGACGTAQRRDAGAAEGTYTVAVERRSFPAEQRLATAAALVLRVRNTGEEAIPDLVVTVRGFSDRSGGARDADLGRNLWIVDEGPGSATTASDDTWAAGRLEPGRTRTLRWRVTPIVAGTHALRYEIAPALAGGARAQLSGGGEPTGALRVRVTDKPAKARVDPRTGAVRRDE